MSQKRKPDVLEALSAEFPANELEWRVQRSGHGQSNRPWAQIVPYIDSRCVRRRLNDVLGPENWQSRMVPSSVGVVCELSIRIDGEWITKTDGSDLTDFEPFKGGCSQALRRAAASFGIGEYLYDIPSTYARFVDAGTAGCERARIDGHDYYWVPPIQMEALEPLPYERPRNAPPVPGRIPVPRAVTARSNAPAEVSSISPARLIVPKTEAPFASTPLSDVRVPFGLPQGRRLADLNEDELNGLVDFYSRVADPRGKAKSFKSVFFAYLASKGGAA